MPKVTEKENFRRGGGEGARWPIVINSTELYELLLSLTLPAVSASAVLPILLCWSMMTWNHGSYEDPINSNVV